MDASLAAPLIAGTNAAPEVATGTKRGVVSTRHAMHARAHPITSRPVFESAHAKKPFGRGPEANDSDMVGNSSGMRSPQQSLVSCLQIGGGFNSPLGC